MFHKKKNVLVTGNFNVLHAGHIRLLKFAKTFADELVVGVFDDQLAGDAVDTSQNLRLEAVNSIDLIDKSYIIENSIEEFIEQHKPDVVVKGKEYEHKFNPEINILKKYGGQIIFSSGEISTSAEIEPNSGAPIPASTRKLLHTLLTRHKVNQSRLAEIINLFSEKRICVLGDTIIDEYIDCFPLGMSQEEPTLVVSPQRTQRFLGGAGIVASHAAQLGASVKFLSISGQDKDRDFAASTLEKYGVDYSFIVDSTRPTTVKQRFRSHGKSLLRVSTLSQQAISGTLQNLILSEFEQISDQCDVVIFSDFNYGCLPQNLVSQIIKIAKQNNTLIAADSQSSSQFGDISRFYGADLITPTEREARLALQNYDDGLVVLADKLMMKTNAKHILLKMGSEGIIAQNLEKQEKSSHTERFDALNPAPIDVSGAGDSVLITSTLALSAGSSLWEASLLGSIAAFVQVGRVGNIPLDKKELLKVLL